MVCGEVAGRAKKISTLAPLGTTQSLLQWVLGTVSLEEKCSGMQLTLASI